MGLVREALQNGGSIHPLIIPEGKDGGLCNPSVFYDWHTDRLLCNLRHVKYTLYQSRKHPHPYGPLVYVHGENDIKLRTVNYMLELDVFNYNIINYKEVNMMELHEPQWEFIGLEDARLVKWGEQLKLIGVRRDTTTNGQGRMEITTLDDDYNEISRERIPAPGDDNSYCEKNWLPIQEMPNMFLKWTNPTEVVSFSDGQINSSYYPQYGLNSLDFPRDIRGGSHVLFIEGHYVAFMHECALYQDDKKRKDANYLHRIVVWDQDWTIKHITDPFYFFNGPIEFCCGATRVNDTIIVSFGHQDNAAYLLTIPLEFLKEKCNL